METIARDVIRYNIYSYLPIDTLYLLSTLNQDAMEAYQERIRSIVDKLKLLRLEGFYGLDNIDKILMELIQYGQPQILGDVYSMLNPNDFGEIFFRTLMRESEYKTIVNIFPEPQLIRYLNMGFGMNNKRYLEFLLQNPKFLPDYEYLPDLVYWMNESEPKLVKELINIHPNRDIVMDEFEQDLYQDE